MSFKIVNLTPLANGKNNKVPCLFSFYNEDGDDVTESNYFSKNCGLKNGDQVVVISQDYSTKSYYYVTVDEEFVITLNQSN